MIRNNQNRRRRSGSGPRPQQLAGGNNYGNRLDNRQRGNASQLLEKYRGLARDSQQAGDRVTAEYYLQYAEHYYRVLGDYRDRQGEPARRPRDYEDEDSAGFSEQDMDGDGEGDESETEVRRDRRPESRGDVRNDAPRNEGRNEGRNEDRNDARGDDNRNWRSERQAGARGPSERRDGGDRDSGNRDAGPRDGGNRERVERDQSPRARDRDWNRDEPRRDELRRDESRRDEIRGDTRRREDRRPVSSRTPVAADDLPEGPIPGLPGPATLSVRRHEELETQPAAEQPALSQSEPVTESRPAEPAVAETGDEAPAPRRRGRPRKVVAETN